jgi:hypothetical protein
VNLIVTMEKSVTGKKAHVNEKWTRTENSIKDVQVLKTQYYKQIIF